MLQEYSGVLPACMCMLSLVQLSSRHIVKPLHCQGAFKALDCVNHFRRASFANILSYKCQPILSTEDTAYACS